MNKEQRFYKIYSNLPLNLREEVIAVIEDEPLTWQVAKLEIDGKTKLSSIAVRIKLPFGGRHR